MQLRVIVVTDPQTNKQRNKQTGAITVHCAAASLARSVKIDMSKAKAKQKSKVPLQRRIRFPCVVCDTTTLRRLGAQE